MYRRLSWLVLVPALILIAFLLRYFLNGESDTFGPEVDGKIPLHIVRSTIHSKWVFDFVYRNPKDNSLHITGQFIGPDPRGAVDNRLLTVSRSSSNFLYQADLDFAPDPSPVENTYPFVAEFSEATPTASPTLHWHLYLGEYGAEWCDTVVSFETPNPGRLARDPAAVGTPATLNLPGLNATLTSLTSTPSDFVAQNWSTWYYDLSSFRWPRIPVPGPSSGEVAIRLEEPAGTDGYWVIDKLSLHDAWKAPIFTYNHSEGSSLFPTADPPPTASSFAFDSRCIDPANGPFLIEATALREKRLALPELAHIPFPMPGEIVQLNRDLSFGNGKIHLIALYGKGTKSPTTSAEYTDTQQLEFTCSGCEKITIESIDVNHSERFFPVDLDPSKETAYSLNVSPQHHPESPHGAEQKLIIIPAIESRSIRFVANPNVTN